MLSIVLYSILKQVPCLESPKSGAKTGTGLANGFAFKCHFGLFTFHLRLLQPDLIVATVAYSRDRDCDFICSTVL